MYPRVEGFYCMKHTDKVNQQKNGNGNKIQELAKEGVRKKTEQSFAKKSPQEQQKLAKEAAALKAKHQKEGDGFLSSVFGPHAFHNGYVEFSNFVRTTEDVFINTPLDLTKTFLSSDGRDLTALIREIIDTIIAAFNRVALAPPGLGTKEAPKEEKKAPPKTEAQQRREITDNIKISEGGLDPHERDVLSHGGNTRTDLPGGGEPGGFGGGRG